MQKKVAREEALQSRRRTEIGYGSGEYTVPEEDVQQFLNETESRQVSIKNKNVNLKSLLQKQEDNLIANLRELAHVVANNQNNKDALSKAVSDMQSVARRLIALRERKYHLEIN